MASLYEINRDILACIDTETGEILDEEKLSALKMDRADKISNIALYIINLRADMKAYKMREEHFAALKKAAETTAARLSDYLARELDGEKIKTVDYSISYRTSKAVEITDKAKIPAIYYKAPKAPEIDKAGIRAALMSGKEIPGAALVTKSNIQIK